MIPLAQKARLEKLLSSRDESIRALIRQESFIKTERRINLPCRTAGNAVTMKSEAQQAWASQLKTSVDGRELVTVDSDKASHYWLRKPERVFPHLHLMGIQLRGGVLATKARGAHGEDRKEKVTTCRGICEDV